MYISALLCLVIIQQSRPTPISNHNPIDRTTLEVGHLTLCVYRPRQQHFHAFFCTKYMFPLFSLCWRKLKLWPSDT